MTSRILVDQRGDGWQLTEVLRRLGFIVEEAILVPDKTHERRTAESCPSGEKCTHEYIRLSAPSRFFLGNHRSIEESGDRPTSAEAVRLFQSLSR